ncbi:Pectinacetylesterase [Cynara cardunculus var. scolymus]|uniref:Pectin acetylesterase n=1 Tax=Cynara cardunculus var. scolymus TaxID=59895 RepID=A0A118JU46_CYNCS|nr:Pectinacetylesterase [Cynara cardunculus var. scolymus]
MINVRSNEWVKCTVIMCIMMFLKTEGLEEVGITIIQSGIAKGAVCLDGSPPAYQLAKGFGDGVSNWLVHIQGGGWCNSVQDCVSRKTLIYGLGSSKLMTPLNFTGILSNEKEQNPIFYNWNRVIMRYCDGSSFTGDATSLYFRGARIFNVIVEELMNIGMKDAQNVFLSGCSAGGLASILHCDKFRGLFPTSTRVKCIADAGYFPHIYPTFLPPMNLILMANSPIVGKSSSNGMFINTCFAHCQSESQQAWSGNDASKLDNKVGITIIESGVAKGAVCLDGSPPAYQLAKGFGDGVNNWLVHIQGGGWCNTVEDCVYRKTMDNGLGSSKLMPMLNFTGILSNEQEQNPNFYNWNRVIMRYCDGSSFTGDVEEVDPATNLYFRGARVFNVIIEELMSKGMNDAQNALLSGCSAGGLASILHCDKFKGFFPSSTRVKCIADAGYFAHTISEGVGDWFYEKSEFRKIDDEHKLPHYC